MIKTRDLCGAPHRGSPPRGASLVVLPGRSSVDAYWRDAAMGLGPKAGLRKLKLIKCQTQGRA